MKMDEYPKYLERLGEIVYMEVVPKTAMFDYFSEHIYRRDKDPQQTLQLLWYLQSALMSDLTFSIFRLFDKKADRNLYDFVNFAETNAAVIRWKSPLTTDDFRNQRELLENVRSIQDNLRTRRNKYFAHYDKRFFYEPQTMEEQYPFSNEDAKALVRVAQLIVAKHTLALTGTSLVSIEQFVYLAAEQLYEKLRQHHIDASNA